MSEEKLKGKAVEQGGGGGGGAIGDHSLDLRLKINDNPLKVDHGESKMELNLLGSLGKDPRNGSSEMSHAVAAAAAAEARKMAPKKFFLCRYCHKRFSNSQALGGHQNAHRRERAATRKDKMDNGITLDQQPNPYYPYSAMAAAGGFSNHHGYGSFGRSPLGVNMHSMIYKPQPYHHHHHHHPFALNNPQYPIPWGPNSGLRVPPEHVGISQSRAPFGTRESSLLANSGAVAARNMIAVAGQPNFREAAAAGFSGNHRQCEPTVTGPNLSLKL